MFSQATPQVGQVDVAANEHISPESRPSDNRQVGAQRLRGPLDEPHALVTHACQATAQVVRGTRLSRTGPT
jgi:hypothetical protein